MRFKKKYVKLRLNSVMNHILHSMHSREVHSLVCIDILKTFGSIHMITYCSNYVHICSLHYLNIQMICICLICKYYYFALPKRYKTSQQLNRYIAGLRTGTLTECIMGVTNYICSDGTHTMKTVLICIIERAKHRIVCSLLCEICRHV